MNRRNFLATLAAGAAALTDPERLLWTPGTKKIFIPRPSKSLPGLMFRKDAFTLASVDLALPPERSYVGYYVVRDGVLWCIGEKTVKLIEPVTKEKFLELYPNV